MRARKRPNHPGLDWTWSPWSPWRRCNCRRCCKNRAQARMIRAAEFEWPANGGVALRRNLDVLDAIAVLGDQC